MVNHQVIVSLGVWLMRFNYMYTIKSHLEVCLEALFVV